MKFKKITAAFAAAAMLAGLAAAPTMAATVEQKGTVTATTMRYIKGWDGNGYSDDTLDIADKKNGLTTYNTDTTATKNDVNFGFASFTIPSDVTIKSATLKLTATHGQYNKTTTAYAAVADLNTTVVKSQTAAGDISSITWANRPTLGSTTAGTSYTTGGSSQYEEITTDKTLSIELKDTEGKLIVNSGDSVTLAIYFNGASARETFSSAVIEYTYDVVTEDKVYPTAVSGVYYANDMTTSGYAAESESAIKSLLNTTAAAEFGIDTNTTHVKQIGSIDNCNDKYSGTVSKTITVAEAGTYAVKLLGYTNKAERTYLVNNVTSTERTEIGIIKNDSNENDNTFKLAVYTAYVPLTAGENTITITGGVITLNGRAPSFVAFKIGEKMTLSAEVVDNSLVTDHGTGAYASDAATGFFAKITSNMNNAAARGLTLSVEGEADRTGDFDTAITVSPDAEVYVGIVVNGMEITNSGAITMTVR